MGLFFEYAYWSQLCLHVPILEIESNQMKVMLIIPLRYVLGGLCKYFLKILYLWSTNIKDSNIIPSLIYMCTHGGSMKKYGRFTLLSIICHLQKGFALGLAKSHYSHMTPMLICCICHKYKKKGPTERWCINISCYICMDRLTYPIAKNLKHKQTEYLLLSMLD